MSHSIWIDHPAHATRELMRHHHLLLAAILGAFIGTLGFALAQPAVNFVRTALSTQTAAVEPVLEFPPREIPPEWQWQAKDLDVDYMYRQYPSQSLDWIREEGGDW